MAVRAIGLLLVGILMGPVGARAQRVEVHLLVDFVDEPIEEALEGLEPAWMKTVREKLLDAEVDAAFEEEKLRTVLAKLSRACGVAIVLDPHVEKVRSAEELAVFMTPFPTTPPR